MADIDALEDRRVAGDALGWLMEMEILQDPNIYNALILNILKCSKHIIDVHLVVDTQNRAILVYLEVGFLGRHFFRNKISMDVENLLKAIPSYRSRVVFDKAILDKAIQILKSRTQNKG